VGFDGTVTFAPHLGVLPGAVDDGFDKRRLKRNLRRELASGTLKVYDYAEVIESVEGLRSGKRAAPCAFVGWDNTPRRGRKGVIITGGTPNAFGADLRHCIDLARSWDPQEPIVFLNAWNEWAEGCHLEPDQLFGTAFLEQVRAATAAARDRGAQWRDERSINQPPSGRPVREQSSKSDDLSYSSFIAYIVRS
jgi:hypothetical protein